jgi:hypothetical protein
MITKQDALNIGKAIVAGAAREKEQYNGVSSIRFHVDGALIYALDNLWYTVFSNKLKEAFNFDKSNFYNAVWEVA